MAYTDIDFTTFWNNNIPPRRRQPKRLARGAVYMKPLQWLRDTFFQLYVEIFYLIDVWDGGTQYSAGNEVVFVNDKGYYKVLDGVTPPIGTDPTNTQYWIKISDNWVGFIMRQRSTSERLKLEYYLNTYFISNYADPPNQSDIFIVNNPPTEVYFLSGFNEDTSNYAVYANDEAVSFITAENPAYSYVTFTVNVPLGIYNALAGDNPTREKIVRQQIDPRISAGTNYEIVTY